MNYELLLSWFCLDIEKHFKLIEMEIHFALQSHAQPHPHMKTNNNYYFMWNEPENELNINVYCNVVACFIWSDFIRCIFVLATALLALMWQFLHVFFFAFSSICFSLFSFPVAHIITQTIAFCLCARYWVCKRISFLFFHYIVEFELKTARFSTNNYFSALLNRNVPKVMFAHCPDNNN